MALISFDAATVSPVFGLTMQSGVKNAVLSWGAMPNHIFEVWANETDNVNTAIRVAYIESNSYQATGLSDATYFWVRARNRSGAPGPYSPSLLYTPVGITSADTMNTPVTAIASGVGSAVASGTVTAYSTWTTACAASFSASANAIYTLSVAAFIDMASVVGTGQEVYVRSRLYDLTSGADVPAGTKTYLIFSNPFGTQRGALNQVFNLNENFVSGFRGLINPGHDYTLFVEVEKVQANGGTGTISVQVGGKVTSSGAASI